jgi:Dolichyl-phosphate-mannose-protein mannosyltransferase
MDLAVALSALKVAVACAGALALGSAAVLRLRGNLSIRTAIEAAALALLALFVLTRGAPHNNELLFAVFDRYGLHGLVLALVLGLLLVAALAWIVAETNWQLPSGLVWHAVAALAVLAALAAAEQVFRLWNAPPWGDSILYDRIAVAIARGNDATGFSYYMPLFQYGPALVYWAFGHLFSAQQIVNLLLAPLSFVFLALAAARLFRSPAAILLVALVAATTDTLRHAPAVPQIENWYVPLFCLSLWAAVRYFDDPSKRNLVLLAIAAGSIFEMRTQASFYVGWLLLAPLWLRDTGALVKTRHAALLAVVVAAIMTPWTIRNALVDGRLSPIGTQAGQRVATASDDPSFFGIRRDLATPLVPTEKSLLQRVAAMAADPAYTLRAAWWRGLAFYGLLPPGVWEKAGPRPTRWAEMPEYLFRTGPTLALLIASLLGLAMHPGRATFFLAGAIAANVALVFFAGFSEPRLSYPLAAVHILLAAAALFRPQPAFAAVHGGVPAGRAGPRRFAAIAAGGVALLVLAHLLVGRHLLYPPQSDAQLMTIGDVAIDRNLPDLNAVIPVGGGAGPLRKGMRARFTAVVTNAMDPVKWVGFPLPGYPDYTADPRRESYYRAYLLDASGTFEWGNSRPVNMALAGARADRALVEDKGIEVEGEVLDVTERGIFWFRADKVRHLDAAPGLLERFP